METFEGSKETLRYIQRVQEALRRLVTTELVDEIEHCVSNITPRSKLPQIIA